MEPESALITKLHAQLSLIRRDRDDAHRRAELAAERARIVKKDRENAAAEVEGMRRKLVEMKEETKRKEKDVGKMEKEVESLNMEVCVRLVFWFFTAIARVNSMNSIFVTNATVQIPTLRTPIQTREVIPSLHQGILCLLFAQCHHQFVS